MDRPPEFEMTSPEAPHPAVPRTSGKKGQFWRCLLLEGAVLLLAWVGIQLTPSPDEHPELNSIRMRGSSSTDFLSYYLRCTYRTYPTAQASMAAIAPAVIAAGVLIACSRQQLPLALLSVLALGTGTILLLPAAVTPQNHFQIELDLGKRDLAAYSEDDLTREFQAQHLLDCPPHPTIRPNTIHTAGATTQFQFKRSPQGDWRRVTVRAAIPIADSISQSLSAANGDTAFLADSYDDYNHIHEMIFLSAFATCLELSASPGDSEIQQLRKWWFKYTEEDASGSGFDDWMRRRAEWRKANPLPKRQNKDRGAP
jgi:hypothetical protein